MERKVLWMTLKPKLLSNKVSCLAHYIHTHALLSLVKGAARADADKPGVSRCPEVIRDQNTLQPALPVQTG